MHRHDKRVWPLAVALAALAGYIDAIGFLWLGGFFISFMSGNSTRLAVGLAEGSSAALIAGGLIAAFLSGAVLGALVASAAAGRRKTAVIGAVTCLLAMAALFAATGYPVAAMTGLALAMGAENAVFRRGGEVSIGVTYMTGTLVKLAQGIADAILGRQRWAWVPYLLLWCGLMAGAVAGASSYALFLLGALWIAVVFSAVLTVLAHLMGPTIIDDAPL